MDDAGGEVAINASTAGTGDSSSAAGAQAGDSTVSAAGAGGDATSADGTVDEDNADGAATGASSIFFQTCQHAYHVFLEPEPAIVNKMTLLRA